jgi:ankyrin repeat protein
LTVLKDNANYTVIGEVGLGSYFQSAWLPPLDEATTDAVDIALTGDVDALSALMDSKGVEFLMEDNFGVTAASISSVNGNLDTVKLLVTRGGISVDATGNTGNSLLTWAAKYGKVDVVNYLIAQNANLNVKNNDGKSALMLAYERGYKSIANALLAAGASVF